MADENNKQMTPQNFETKSYCVGGSKNTGTSKSDSDITETAKTF